MYPEEEVVVAAGDPAWQTSLIKVAIPAIPVAVIAVGMAQDMK
jgi:hypothetical protein